MLHEALQMTCLQARHKAAENIVPHLVLAKARYTELGTETNLETLTLFASPPTAVSVGVGRAYKKG